jgi:hypothetical protein
MEAAPAPAPALEDDDFELDLEDYDDEYDEYDEYEEDAHEAPTDSVYDLKGLDLRSLGAPIDFELDLEYGVARHGATGYLHLGACPMASSNECDFEEVLACEVMPDLGPCCVPIADPFLVRAYALVTLAHDLERPAGAPLARRARDELKRLAEQVLADPACGPLHHDLEEKVAALEAATQEWKRSCVTPLLAEMAARGADASADELLERLSGAEELDLWALPLSTRWTSLVDALRLEGLEVDAFETLLVNQRVALVPRPLASLFEVRFPPPLERVEVTGSSAELLESAATLLCDGAGTLDVCVELAEALA